MVNLLHFACKIEFFVKFASFYNICHNGSLEDGVSRNFALGHIASLSGFCLSEFGLADNVAKQFFSPLLVSNRAPVLG